MIHLHGKPKDKSLNSLINKYSKRLESESVKIIEHTDNLSPNEYISKLIKYAKTGDLILLDQKGIEYDSLKFSQLVSSWKLNSEDTHLAIGPASGFPEHNLSKISLSKMTFSHQMIRLFFVEQLYRGFSILNNEPYHHK